MLLDFSGSLTDTEFDKYINMFRNSVLANMTFDDEITLIPIDKASETKSEIIGKYNFNAKDLSARNNKNRYDLFTKEETLKKSIDSLKDTLFQSNIYNMRKARQNFSSLTDIIASTNEATHYLQSTGKRKILFIFSDMIQESSDINVLKIDSFDQIDKRLEGLEHSDLIPDLKDVIVFVSGATAKTNQRYRIHKEFWQRFFKRAGSNIYDYGYNNSDRIETALYEIRHKKL